MGGIKELLEPLYGTDGLCQVCVCESSKSLRTTVIQPFSVLSVFLNECRCELATFSPLTAIRRVPIFKKTFGLYNMAITNTEVFWKFQDKF